MKCINTSELIRKENVNDLIAKSGIKTPIEENEVVGIRFDLFTDELSLIRYGAKDFDNFLVPREGLGVTWLLLGIVFLRKGAETIEYKDIVDYRCYSL